MGAEARRHPCGGVGPAAHRLVEEDGSKGIHQREREWTAHPRICKRNFCIPRQGTGCPWRRRGDCWNRCRTGGHVRSTIPESLLNARQRKVWFGEFVQSRPTSADWRDCDCSPAEDCRRIRQSSQGDCDNTITFRRRNERCSLRPGTDPIAELEEQRSQSNVRSMNRSHVLSSLSPSGETKV